MRQIAAIFFVMMLVIISPAAAFKERPTEPSGGSTVVNIGGTLKGDKGDQGIQGIQGIPGVMNLTINMTANMTGNMTAGTTDYLLLDNLPDMSQYPFLNGTRQFTALINLGGFNISNLLNPVAAQDAATKDYVDAHPAINETYATTANLSSTNNTMKDYVDVAVAGIIIPDQTQFFFLNGTRNLTGNMNVWGFRLTNITSNTDGGDAVNKTYVDTVNTSMLLNVSSNFLNLDGSRAMIANLNMGMKEIQNVVGNQRGSSAVNKTYVDTWRNTNITRPVVIESDFYDATTGAIPGLLGVALSSGTLTTAPTRASANHPGVVNLTDSTTAGGGYKFGCTDTTLIAGKEVAEFIFSSNGARYNQTARLGWADSIAAATMVTDGVYLNITGRTAFDNEILTGVSASNGARTATASNYVMAQGTWYHGIIQINDAGTLATYTLLDDAGAVLWTDTTNSNIPTGAGRATGACIIAGQPSTDALAVILTMDYAKWDVNRTVTRG